MHPPPTPGPGGINMRIDDWGNKIINSSPKTGKQVKREGYRGSSRRGEGKNMDSSLIYTSDFRGVKEQ